MPSGPVLEHVVSLTERFPYDVVAHAAGVTRETVRDLLNRPRPMMNAATAAKLMAVTDLDILETDAPDPKHFIDLVEVTHLLRGGVRFDEAAAKLGVMEGSIANAAAERGTASQRRVIHEAAQTLGEIRWAEAEDRR